MSWTVDDTEVTADKAAYKADGGFLDAETAAWQGAINFGRKGLTRLGMGFGLASLLLLLVLAS